jgi:hypothetical protein
MVSGEVLVFEIHFRFVPVGAADGAFQVVADYRPWHAAEEKERIPVGEKELFLLLAAYRLDVQVVAGAENGDEELGFTFDTMIEPGSRGACEIDEEPVARLVLHGHGQLGCRRMPLTEQVAELAAFISVRMPCLVFLPLKLPCDTGLRQLRKHVMEKRERSLVPLVMTFFRPGQHFHGLRVRQC